MANLDDRVLIDAGLALLRADAGLVVYPDAEGAVPLSPTPPYVRVYGAVERTPDRLDGTSGQMTTRWWCHCVGATEPAALAVAMRVRVALLDQRVAGGMVRQEVQPPPTRDESTGTAVYDVVAVYRLITF
jgi:hypothetical protein